MANSRANFEVVGPKVSVGTKWIKQISFILDIKAEG